MTKFYEQKIVWIPIAVFLIFLLMIIVLVGMNAGATTTSDKTIELPQPSTAQPSILDTGDNTTSTSETIESISFIMMIFFPIMMIGIFLLRTRDV
jgi:hypothetical protein